MQTRSALVIVGASYAGVQLAAAARESGFDAPIVLLGDERHAPYQRPPLSKGLLTGKTRVDALALKGESFYADHAIDLRLGTRAVALDTASRSLILDDGGALEYGWLALTTGARCRPLSIPGAELGGVFNLRTLDDALGVSVALARAGSVCVIGGGFIGLEVAGAVAARGIPVTVIESQPRLLARCFPPQMSDYLARAHRQRGVELALGCGVRALHGADGQVREVELADGRRIACDMVVLGIGVLPNSELAEQAGIACDNGILTDALGRASAARVLAVGDVANTVMPVVAGGPARMRLESIQAANDGARAAASGLVGQSRPFEGAPWFWSDQHDLKLQMAGLPAQADQIVLRGDMQGDKFSIFYLRAGRVAAVHTVNRPADHMLARKWIAAGAKIDPALLRDESVDLKAVPLQDASADGKAAIGRVP